MKKETRLSRGSLTKLRELNLERIFLIKAGELMWRGSKVKKGAALRRELP